MATMKKLGFAAALALVAATGCMNELDPMTPPPNQDPPVTTPPAQDPPVTTPPPTTTPPTTTPPPTTVPPPTTTPPPAGSSAKALFDMNVAPTLLAGCGNGTCHGGTGTSPIRFVPATPATAYDTALMYSDKLFANTFDKTRAQVLLKIAGGHYNATYTPTQKTGIDQWLDAEVAARAGGTTTPNVRRQLMAQWSGCMTLTDWNAEGVANAWANKNTNEGTCQQCHVNAQGWLASQDSQRVFDILSTQTNTKTGGMYMEYYFVPDTTTDPANPKMVLNRGSLDRAASGFAQHPRFTVDGDAYSRLTRFYDKTMAKKAAGTCATPRFTP